MLTTQLPWPPVSGGAMKSWKLVERFSESFELSLGVLLKDDNTDNEPGFLDQVTLANYCSKKVTRPRNAINLMRSYLQSDTLNVFRNKVPEMAEWVKQQASTTDVLLVDHYEMFQYVPDSYTGKVVLHEHNAEYVIWERFAELETDAVKKTVLKTETARVKKAEKKYCERANMVLATPNDIEKLVSIGADRSKCKVTYHLGDDSMATLPPVTWQQTQPSLLFIGTLPWEPNANGLIWFIDKCWPELKAQMPELAFDIVGKNPDQRLLQRAAADPDINLHGFVEDLEPLHQSSRVFIVPLLFGSGMKVKVLHGMYRGLPMVTTTIGAEGIDLVNGAHACVVPTGDAGTFVDEIVRLMTERELWEQLRDASRELARTQYSWPQHLELLESYIIDLLA